MTTETLTLAEFLTARLDERERVAREAAGPSWAADAEECCVITTDEGALLESSPMGWSNKREAVVRHVVLNDPAHVLADIATHRRVIAERDALAERIKKAWHEYSDWLAGKATPDPGTYSSASDRDVLAMYDHVIAILAVAFADHPDYDAERWGL